MTFRPFPAFGPHSRRAGSLPFSPASIGSAGGASGRAPVTLPTPSFGTTGLVCWIDTAYTDYLYSDTVGRSSVGAIEDLSGNGRGFIQADKSIQPSLGANGGLMFDQQAQYMDCVLKDMLNGLNKWTIYAAARLDAATYLAVGAGGGRSVLYVSEASASASPAGGGSSAERASLHLSSGTTGRKPFTSVSAADGTTANSSTTSPAVTSLATDSKVYFGVEVDLTGVTAKTDVWLNGALNASPTWTPAEGSSPWALNTPDSVSLRLGNNQALNRVLCGEILALVVLNQAPTDAAHRDAIEAYLAARIA